MEQIIVVHRALFPVVPPVILVLVTSSRSGWNYLHFTDEHLGAHSGGDTCPGSHREHVAEPELASLLAFGTLWLKDQTRADLPGREYGGGGRELRPREPPPMPWGWRCCEGSLLGCVGFKA